MIGGTVIIEDMNIHFTVVEDNTVLYTVADSLSGAQESKRVDAKNFMYGLMLAISFDGDFPDNPNYAWELAEDIQPDNGLLRFIP